MDMEHAERELVAAVETTLKRTSKPNYALSRAATDLSRAAIQYLEVVRAERGKFTARRSWWSRLWRRER